MKTLVTGGTGFLGSHIVERLLEQGHQVRALARKTSDLTFLNTTAAEIVFGTLEDYDSLRAAVDGMDVVIHAAARVLPGWGRWEDFDATIVKGTENLLNASIEAGVSRFVYVSSGTVMGKASFGDTAADESAPYEIEFSPDAYYDWAKMQAEKLALDYHKQGKISVVVARPCMIYGPRCRLLTDRIYKYVKMLKMFPVLPGKSDARMALVHVTDVADCIILSATNEKAGGQIYNIAPAEKILYRDFINAMAWAAGSSKFRLSIPISLVYITATVTEFWAKLWRNKNLPFLTRSDIGFIKNGMNIDGSKAVRELGWESKISLEEGTRLYVQWRRSQKKK